MPGKPCEECRGRALKPSTFHGWWLAGRSTARLTSSPSQLLHPSHSSESHKWPTEDDCLSPPSFWLVFLRIYHNNPICWWRSPRWNPLSKEGGGKHRYGFGLANGLIYHQQPPSLLLAFWGRFPTGLPILVWVFPKAFSPEVSIPYFSYRFSFICCPAILKVHIL